MPARRFVIAAWALTFFFSLPHGAAAQKSAFIDAFIAFHSALPGTYGDEGVQISAALDRMATTLEMWERENRAAEERVRARPGSTPADLALLYIDQYRLEDAISSMQAAIAADPGRTSYSVLLGLLQHATGHIPDAGKAFDAARAADPADPIAAYLVTASLADRGGGDGLVPLIETLLASADRGGPPRSWPFPRLTLVDDLSADTPIFSPPAYADGFASMAAGRFRDALEEFRKAAAADPLVADTAMQAPQIRAGIRALRDQRGAEAVAQLEAAVAALPSSSEAHRTLGVAYRAVGKLPESIGQFESAVRLAPRWQRARIALGSTLMEAGRLEDAERVLRETLEILPVSGDARWTLAQLYERLDRATDAIQILEGATSLTVMAGKAQLYWRIAQLAHAYHRDNARVIAATSQRTWLLVNEPQAHKDMGMAHYRAGRMEEALAELLMAALLGLEDAEMLGAIAQIHLEAGRLEMAERMSRRAVALDADFPQPRYVLGSTLRRIGRLDEGTEQLDAFHRLQVKALEAQRRTFESDSALNHARHLVRQGRLTEATTAYEKAATLTGSGDVLRELAAIYARLGRADDRARALARADAMGR